MYPGMWLKVTKTMPALSGRDLQIDEVVQLMSLPGVRTGGILTFVGVDGVYLGHLSGQHLEPAHREENKKGQDFRSQPLNHSRFYNYIKNLIGLHS